MSRILLFSDLHAHAWTDFASVTQYRGQAINSRLADAAKVIDWVRRMAVKHGADEVLFGGDLFHKKQILDIPVYNVTAAALFRLARALPLTIMAGNHDLTRRSAEAQYSTEHALFALGGHPNITVVDQPTVREDGVGLIPYGSDRDTTLHGVGAVEGQAKWLVMHAGISGAMTGPVEFQPYEPVSTADLPQMPIYSGHYHLPQTVDERVTYIGAPLELVRGDGHSKRGAMLVERETGAVVRRLRYRGPQFHVAQAWDLPEDLSTYANHFVDLQVRDTVQVDKAYQALMAAGARAVHPDLVAEVAPVRSRLPVEVHDNGLPTVEQLCRGLVKQSGSGFDTKKLWDLAQEALHAADTADEC